MFEIKLLDKTTNKVFIKTYTSYYLYQKDLNKFNHSSKLQVIYAWQN